MGYFYYYSWFSLTCSSVIFPINKRKALLKNPETMILLNEIIVRFLEDMLRTSTGWPLFVWNRDPNLPAGTSRGSYVMTASLI